MSHYRPHPERRQIRAGSIRVFRNHVCLPVTAYLFSSEKPDIRNVFSRKFGIQSGHEDSWNIERDQLGVNPDASASEPASTDGNDEPLHAIQPLPICSKKIFRSRFQENHWVPAIVTRLVRSLAIIQQAENLAGRPVWIIIGDRDKRVGTGHAIDFARTVTKASLAKGLNSQVELHVPGTMIPKGLWRQF